MSAIICLLGTSFFIGDWRNWHKFHTTLMYWIICTLLYEFLTYTHPLWVYKPEVFVNHTITSLIVIFIIYPAALYLYLPYFPKSRLLYKILYIVAWAIFATIMEWVYLDHFLYYNGWNLGWSLVLDILMFMMLKLHFHKPILTYCISVLAAVGFLVIFKVPILEMK